MIARGPIYEWIKQELAESGLRMTSGEIAERGKLSKKKCMGAITIMVGSGELIAHRDPQRAHGTRYSLPSGSKLKDLRGMVKKAPIRTGYVAPAAEYDPPAEEEVARDPVPPSERTTEDEFLASLTIDRRLVLVGLQADGVSRHAIFFTAEQTERIAELLRKAE